jgi:hypothetical protein
MFNDFDKDFEYFWNRIFIDKVPTVFARYADGESALIKGVPIGPESMVARIDGWSAPNNVLTTLGADLRRTIKRINPNYFYAISCTCCDKPTRDFLLSIIHAKPEQLTYANLWINGNYNTFINKLNTIKVYIIGNVKGKDNIYPFEIDYSGIPNDCINYWATHKLNLKDFLSKKFSGLDNPLVLVAAGPMSELLVDYLWTVNPNGRYIDVGSALDEFIFNKKTREYMNNKSDFNRRKCINEIINRS